MAAKDEQRGMVYPETDRNYITRRLNHADILDSACKTWDEQERTAQTIATESIQLIHEAYEENPSFFGSRSKKWILGGLFYLLGREHKQPKTQKQIAKALDATEMTIRASCREWLKHFPELWTKQTTKNQRNTHEKTGGP